MRVIAEVPADRPPDTMPRLPQFPITLQRLRKSHRRLPDCAAGDPDFKPNAEFRETGSGVKGGVNLDHFGGAKVDQLVKG